MTPNPLEYVMAAIGTDLGYQITVLEHAGTRYESSQAKGMLIATHPYFELIIRDQAQENQEVIGSCFLSKNELKTLTLQLMQRLGRD